MSIDPSEFVGLRIKHLEMVQTVISRLAGQGATIKNYCITMSTTVCGFSITLHRPLVALLALLPLLVFAFLDGQYLRTERRYRLLYDQVRTGDWGAMPNFELKTRAAPRVSYGKVLFSWSIIGFYGPIALGVLSVVFVARYRYGTL